ncbi:MAG TPA: ferritin-like domain-containing protein [Chromatiaceae bacterium]|jgi:rubrerythrin|nr:MAG: hypothetical protein N838_10205 [Thiohalocapsa sp. PB-PSB1]QQO57306.1 MAG: ferritin-like domain-containing protein [Thiohalocapsa sp. PB-PSB1]HBG96852.1 ferritin-like domain-containing protein [Chromatiaceae bacterium]HCS91497.1 ferritin-like domain-containing protein [Chromatiaceae bacterium]
MSVLKSASNPTIIRELYDAFTVDGMSLMDVVWEQQRYHESRRWSVVDFFDRIDPDAVSDRDKVVAWNAGRAELTTKPGADRLTRLADKETRAWSSKNPVVANIMQACGTWSRYWNEEEAFHETSLNMLAQRLGMPIVDDETFIEYRKVFPDDDMLRTLTLLAGSEIVAATNYSWAAESAEDPALQEMFRRISSDEIQHMTYFVSFARALVRSGEYPAKNAFAVGYLFLRNEGELAGSSRETIESRGNTHVNWWDHLENLDDMPAVDLQPANEKKTSMFLVALKRITGIEVASVDEVEAKWMELAAAA